MVDMTLIRPLNEGQVIHFGTNRFLINDIVKAANSNFCSRTHRLATIHNVTDDRQTDVTLCHKRDYQYGLLTCQD